MEQGNSSFFYRFLNGGKTWGFFSKVFLMLFVLNLIIRIPLYFSKNFWFDGDEAIIGIMAQDFLRTGKLPFFFYGQHYGFASVETFFAALFIKILGAKVIALKLAGLAIHALAMSFIALTLRAKKVSVRFWLFALILVLFFPTFYLWASQMRTTAFLLASILLYISVTQAFSWLRFSLVLLVSFLLLESQAMFFMFTMVLVGDWLWKARNKFFPISIFLGSLVALVFLVNIYFAQGGPAHSVGLNTGIAQWNQLWFQMNGLLSGFSGFHYFTIDIDMPLWYSIVALLLMGSFIGFALAILVRSWRVNKRTVIFYVIAMIGFLLFLSCFVQYSPRYWINFFGGTLIVILSMSINTEFALMLNKKMFIFLLPLIAICFVAPQMRVHFSDNEIPEKEAFGILNQEVRISGQKAIFTTDVYLQWQWNYLNGQDIPCCAFFEKERTDRFSQKVFHIHRKSPKQVGLIGFWGVFWEMDLIDGFNNNRYQVGEKYYFLKQIDDKYYKRGLEVSGG